MTKLRITSIPAGSEPGTSAATTAHLAGFLDGATLDASGTGERNRNCCCLHAKNGHTHEDKPFDSRYLIYVSVHLQPLTVDLRLQASTPSNQL